MLKIRECTEGESAAGYQEVLCSGTDDRLHHVSYVWNLCPRFLVSSSDWMCHSWSDHVMIDVSGSDIRIMILSASQLSESSRQ